MHLALVSVGAAEVHVPVLWNHCRVPEARKHTSAYVSIRQHTSAYVSICQHPSHTSRVPEARQHTSAYVSIRQHTSAYVTHQSGPRSTPSLRAQARESIWREGRGWRRGSPFQRAAPATGTCSAPVVKFSSSEYFTTHIQHIQKGQPISCC